MNSRSLIPVVLASLVPASLLAQAKPLDRSEVFGRLAVGDSPSYIAHLVKTRPLTFTPDAKFISQIRLAGGDGVLVQRLQSAPVPAASDLSVSRFSSDHLAKCAELVHAELLGQADSECRAAIAENPQSPWPLLATAQLSEQRPPVLQRPWEFPDASKQRSDLLNRAVALAPDLAVAHYALATVSSPEQAGRELSQANSLDADQLENAQRLSEASGQIFAGADLQNLANKDVPLRPSVDAPIGPFPFIDRLVALDPDLAINHTFLAEQYAAVGNYDRAEMELREAIRLEPDNLVVLLPLAMFHLQRRQFDTGLAELHQAVGTAPTAMLPHLLLAVVYKSLSRPADAVEEIRSLESFRPADPVVSQAVAEFYLYSGDHHSAALALQRSLTLSEQTTTDPAKLYTLRHDDYVGLARLLQETRQSDGALALYAKMLRYEPESASLHNDYGNVLLDRGRTEDALSEYRDALRIDPSMSSPHHNIGLCLLRKKDYNGAVAEFQQALALNPNEPNSKFFLAAALSHSGDTLAAHKQLEDAPQRDSDDPKQHSALAFTLEEMKDSAGAVRELKIALRLAPDSPDAQNDLAWLYATSADTSVRNPQEALRLAKLAVKNSPTPVAAFLDTLAEALLLNGQPAEALTTEQQAFELDSQNPELQSRLAHFREATQRPVPAKP